MLPSRSGILAKAISIASTCLQQRQSISPASSLQFLHLHKSRFPILIFNKSAAEVWICLVPLLFFSWLSLRHVFFVQAQTKTVEEWWSKWLHCHMYLPQNHHFLLHHLYFQYFFHWIYSALKHLLIIYVIDLLTKNKM